ncbi:hypothetical protein AYY19_10965 [Photobacterium aquimaris]|uniref:Capsular biosynthesis protein n=1 Tax=Photobacterium aquimaris TaxID=512643 RepID=A0A2T3IPR8_9GAMM|nr:MULTISPECIES: outer membrane beta-barrel protein [Photobacterium]OBU17235.1 hypothetical protein AYY20_06355 [Photobacterium aquimaris]OBU17966.1 hypothetical protein AYY19_10965 [Photobacterium aquimaris]PSU30349.1 hypothetical protein CTM88_04885 [Photobacterium aquimaris]PSW00322.1 hypothetical protein CTM91_12150 [Photobacterium aquimaris]
MCLFKTKKIHLVLVGCFCATSSFVASADSTFQNSKHIDPLLGLEFSSSVSSGYGFDDNVLHQLNDNIISSDYYSLKPVFSVVGQRNTKNFGLYYSGDYRHYTNNEISDDSYDDHQLHGVFKWELGFRHHFELTGSYSQNHEALGTGVTNGFFFDNETQQNNAATFNNFNISHDIGKTKKKINAKYTYGAKNAKGNLVFDFSREYTDYDILDSYQSAFKEYLKNENVTESDFKVTFRHQYTDKTRFDYTLLYKDFRYLDHERDNDELIGAFSIISQLTGKSKVEATISNVQKKMQSSNFSGVNWNLSYQWQPVDYSKIILKTLSEAKEPDNIGDFVQSLQNSITWQHQFLGHITSNLSYKHISDKYHIRKRKDRYDYLDLSLNYLFRPKVEFSLGYKYMLFHTNNSADPVFIDGNSYIRKLGYEQNQFGLSVKVAI